MSYWSSDLDLEQAIARRQGRIARIREELQKDKELSIVQLPSGIAIIDGTFYTIQRADINGSMDTHGNPRLEWPGRSVYGTQRKAEEVAALMAGRYDQYPFVVMKAVAAFARAKESPPVVRRKL